MWPRFVVYVGEAQPGLKNREIAQRLSITSGTVKVYLMHVFEKTGVKDRYALAAQAKSLLGDNGGLLPKGGVGQGEAIQ